MRRPALDALKGICILLVVFNHALIWPMRTGDRVSAFAYGIAFGTVAAFSAVAGYVHGMHPPRDELALLKKRTGQLLVPWLIWAPLYALAPLAWRAAGGGALPIATQPWPWARAILLGGGPLWFLPVLLATTMVCGVLDKRTSRWWPFFGALALYAAIAVPSALANISPLDVGNGTFWAVAPLYVAAFWFGLRVSRDGLPRVPSGALWAMIGVSMATAGAVTLLRASYPEAHGLMWLPYAIGMVDGCAATLLAARAPLAGGRAEALLARVGVASLGIYILHPLLAMLPIYLAGGRGGAPVAGLIALATIALGTLLVERLRVIKGVRRAL